MADLTTEYLGLKLKNPIVPSASPFSKNVDTALELEDAGAAAIVMHSLFEEKITYENEHMERFFHQQAIGHGEADSFHPVPQEYKRYQDVYIEQLNKLRNQLDIPIIASLNGITSGGWVEYAKVLQLAGADALELNVYYVAANAWEDSQQIEARYIELLNELRENVSIPITMKLSHHFSALIPFAQQLEKHGTNGIVLFNRFYQPDINLETLKVEPRLELSSSMEALLRIRWTAILFDHLDCSMAVTGGIHTHEDVIKALLAGADVAHMCSALLKHGPRHIDTTLQLLKQWMEDNEYESVKQMIGSISRSHAIDPSAFERANYIDILDSYSHPSGVLR